MDLVAIASDDGFVNIHRLSWQKVLQLHGPTKPGLRSLAWGPDGKLLAVGLEDGSVVVYDVEHGESVYSGTPHGSAVVALHWQEIDDDASSVVLDRCREFLPPLGALRDTAKGGGRPQGATRLTVLVSADSNATIAFSALGTSVIARIDLRSTLPCASIVRISLSKQMKTLTVIAETPSTDGKRATHLLVFDTHCLWDSRWELLQLSVQWSAVNIAVEAVKECLQTLHQQWSQAWSAFAKVIDELSQTLDDHGTGFTAREALLECLSTGLVSDALRQFLAAKLTLAGGKKVAKAVSTGSTNVSQQLSRVVQATLETVLYRIGDLRGASKWKQKFQRVGLDENALCSLLEHGSALMCQTEHAVRAALQMQNDVAITFEWLLNLVLVCDDPNAAAPLTIKELKTISQFVRTHLPVDSVSPYLDKDPGSTTSLIAMVNGFSDTCAQLSLAPVNALSPTLSCVGSFVVMERSGVSDSEFELQQHFASASLKDDHESLLAFTGFPGSASSLCLVKIDLPASDKTVSMMFSVVTVAETPTHIDFFSTETLAIVTTAKCEGNSVSLGMLDFSDLKFSSFPAVPSLQALVGSTEGETSFQRSRLFANSSAPKAWCVSVCGARSVGSLLFLPRRIVILDLADDDEEEEENEEGNLNVTADMDF